EKNDLNRDVFAHGGGEFLNVHHEGAVSIDVDNSAVRESDFAAECSGKAEAHGTEAQRANVAAGLVELVELCRPHLVLAHASGDDGLALGLFVHGLDSLL